MNSDLDMPDAGISDASTADERAADAVWQDDVRAGVRHIEV